MKGKDRAMQLRQRKYPEAVQSLNSLKQPKIGTPALRIEHLLAVGSVLSPECVFSTRVLKFMKTHFLAKDLTALNNS